MTLISPKPDDKYFQITIEQNGQKYEVNSEEITLQKKPFTLICKLYNSDGILLNASFDKKFYSLKSDEQPEGLEYIATRSYAEYLFNRDSSLFLSDDGMHFLRYWETDTGVISKYNHLEINPEFVIGERYVKRFLSTERIFFPVEEVEKPLYLFFICCTKSKPGPVKELQRQKLRINWK